MKERYGFPYNAKKYKKIYSHVISHAMLKNITSSIPAHWTPVRIVSLLRYPNLSIGLVTLCLQQHACRS